jgi:hypothetical protein
LLAAQVRPWQGPVATSPDGSLGNTAAISYRQTRLAQTGIPCSVTAAK